MTNKLLSHLAGMPLTWLLATLLVYRASSAVYQRAGMHPLLHPVALSTAVLGTAVWIAGVPYHVYFEGARFIHLLLGPVTVALALPLYEQLKQVRQNWRSVFFGTLAGSLASVLTAMPLASLLGASRESVLSMAAKSVTMPIAIALTEELGGSASLTSALVMLTGILGSAIAMAVLRRTGMTDPAACGLAIGVAAHGIGTSKALQLGSEMGAFAGLGMSVAGVFTAILVPALLKMGGWP